VVVVPHPDDEVLGCGGLILRQCRLEREVRVVAVTDGEAAFGEGDRRLAAKRRREQQNALTTLGLHGAQVIRLGLADGRVWEVQRGLAEMLARVVSRDDLLVAPWVNDHHVDHVACAFAADAAARTTGCQRIGSLVWGPIRSNPPAAVDPPLLRLHLSNEECDRRQRALRCHHSQLDDRVGPAVVVDDLVDSMSSQYEWYVGAGDV
jgi:LmbE family N-acetylglucosaminyl deacetylase